MLYKRIIAIDPSLTCSGWALFNLQNRRLIGVGKIASLSPATAMSLRLANLQTKIKDLFCKLSLAASDVLICEAATSVMDPRAAFKVETVRSIFEVIARENGVTVPGRINPRTVQSQVMGLSGKQIRRISVKEAAVNTVIALHSVELEKINFDASVKNLSKNQDIVDAILIGSLAVTKIYDSFAAQVELEELLQRN